MQIKLGIVNVIPLQPHEDAMARVALGGDSAAASSIIFMSASGMMKNLLMKSGTSNRLIGRNQFPNWSQPNSKLVATNSQIGRKQILNWSQPNSKLVATNSKSVVTNFKSVVTNFKSVSTNLQIGRHQFQIGQHQLNSRAW